MLVMLCMRLLSSPRKRNGASLVVTRAHHARARLGRSRHADTFDLTGGGVTDPLTSVLLAEPAGGPGMSSVSPIEVR